MPLTVHRPGVCSDHFRGGCTFIALLLPLTPYKQNTKCPAFRLDACLWDPNCGHFFSFLIMVLKSMLKKCIYFDNIIACSWRIYASLAGIHGYCLNCWPALHTLARHRANTEPTSADHDATHVHLTSARWGSDGGGWGLLSAVLGRNVLRTLGNETRSLCPLLLPTQPLEITDETTL